MVTAEKLKVKGDKLFIGGKWVESHSEKTWPVYNPATGKKLADVVIADKKDVDKAVAAARKAFESGPWHKMNASERGRLLTRIGDLIEKHGEELAMLETMNNGKTIAGSRSSDVPASAGIFHYYAGWANKHHGETIPVDGPYLNYTLREPMGVVGQIVPWNYPLLMACWKLAPALAMGNTAILKPAELTPLTALRLADILNEAGVPEGVVSILTGEGSTGAAIANHMDIDKVAFTGSTEVGRKIMAAAAQSNLKRVSLELGGKSPNVVFPDADLEAAAKGAFWAIFVNKGEVCSAGSRLVVHQDIHDEFIHKLVERAKKMRVGDPMDEKTQMGAQVSKEQMERILSYIEIGQQEGAKVAVGGHRDTEGAKKDGCFVKPTIFTGVKNDMRIAQEEIFGPVLVSIPFKTEEEAIRICNRSIYGLAAAVWTKDVGRAHAMARKIQAGTVWINLWDGFDVASPFGGYKQSGFGREMGIHALEMYTQTKSVWVKLEDY